MARAIWKGCVLAESEDTVDHDGVTYFPTEALNAALLRPTNKQRFQPSRGTSTYFDLEVNGRIVSDVAWILSGFGEESSTLVNRVAFYSGVDVVRA